AAGVVARQLLTGSSADVTVTGQLGVLLAHLTDPDPERRPRSAAVALDALGALGVPRDAAWPEVPDVLGDPAPPVRVLPTYLPLAAASFAAAVPVGAALAWLLR
ncbi:MAG: hypothetical protein ABIO16_16340, partial [Nocardioides sp.]